MQKNQVTAFKDGADLKLVLFKNYQKQIENFLGSPEKALEFLSNVMESVRRTPKLLECTPESVVNSFMMMAQLKLMPSAVSGEAYVLPYKRDGVLEAQFQLGYQGIVTLLYRAGAKSVVAELVREKDSFTLKNGKINHEVNPFLTKEQRGKAVGAYAIITNANGGSVEQFMHIDDIQKHAKKFSKSFNSEYSPWDASNDPEGWMPRKTMLKQTSKLAPKNETLARAIAEDNKDSIIGDRLEAAKRESESLAMGNLLKHGEENQAKSGEENQDGTTDAESAQTDAPADERVIQ